MSDRRKLRLSELGAPSGISSVSGSKDPEFGQRQCGMILCESYDLKRSSTTTLTIVGADSRGEVFAPPFGLCVHLPRRAAGYRFDGYSLPLHTSAPFSALRLIAVILTSCPTRSPCLPSCPDKGSGLRHVPVTTPGQDHGPAIETPADSAEGEESERPLHHVRTRALGPLRRAVVLRGRRR